MVGGLDINTFIGVFSEVSVYSYLIWQYGGIIYFFRSARNCIFLWGPHYMGGLTKKALPFIVLECSRYLVSILTFRSVLVFKIRSVIISLGLFIMKYINYNCRSSFFF